MYLIEFEIPGATEEQYQRIWDILGQKGLVHPKGRAYHFGAPAPNGWRVIDVWSDMADFEAFGKTLVPAMVEVGIQPPAPRVLPIVKTVVAPGTAR
jgi:hypothetical protein